MNDWKNVNFQTLQEIQKIWNKNFINSFKKTWIQLNSIRLIDLKMRSNFNKIRMLRLCTDLSFMMNHQKNLKYCMINMKVNKACRVIDNMMKKNYFLNKIWLKFRRDSSKLNFVLTILKTHKNKTILIVSYFSEMLMYVKQVSRYFIISFMFVISQFVISSRELSSVWYFYMIWWILIKFL